MLLPHQEDWLLVLVFTSGGGVFFFAMYWDTSDTSRVTRKLDVAFWLHLLADPLMIRPVFSGLDILDGSEDLLAITLVIVLYLFMTSISLVIDRRALMVSSLIYVLYAISGLIKNYGGLGFSFALTGVLMGAMLLLLSAYWHRSRAQLIAMLPDSVKLAVPAVK